MFSDSLRTWAEVDLDAVLHNFLAARNRLPEHMKLLATVKANGYGHGAIPIAKLLEDKADYFALATMDEAVQLRQARLSGGLLLAAAHPRGVRRLSGGILPRCGGPQPRV